MSNIRRPSFLTIMESYPYKKVFLLCMSNLGKMFVRGEGGTAVHMKVKDSIFLKDLAVLIWGKDNLTECSMTGQKCPGNGAPPKKQLSLYKYTGLKGELVISVEFLLHYLQNLFR